MSVVVYTMPSCVQCDRTKKYMDEREIKYSVVDISKSKEAYELVMSLGYKQAPVVTAGNMHWSGFRPDKIDIIKPTREGI